MVYGEKEVKSKHITRKWRNTNAKVLRGYVHLTAGPAPFMKNNRPPGKIDRPG